MPELIPEPDSTGGESQKKKLQFLRLSELNPVDREIMFYTA
jgi:hypothetical protein